MMMTMAMTLPGTCINYYGDEIGMARDGQIGFNDTQDTFARPPYADEEDYQEKSRDPVRTPMQVI